MKINQGSKRQNEWHVQEYRKWLKKRFKSRAMQALNYYSIVKSGKTEDEICTKPRKPKNTQFLNPTEVAHFLKRIRDKKAPVAVRDEAFFTTLIIVDGITSGELLDLSEDNVYQIAGHYELKTAQGIYFISHDLFDLYMRYRRLVNQWIVPGGHFWFGNNGNQKMEYFENRPWKGKGTNPTHAVWNRLKKYFVAMRKGKAPELRSGLRGKTKLLERIPKKPQDPEYIDRL